MKKSILHLADCVSQILWNAESKLYMVYQIYRVWAILLFFFVLYIDVQRLCESSLWWNDQQSKKVRKQAPRLCVKNKTFYIRKDANTAKTV